MFFFFQAEDGIRVYDVTGVQTCALPISAHAKDVFVHHRAEVIEAVPADRLLVFDVSEGWDPLCKHLDRPAPAEPFPRVNTTKEFWELIDGATSA